MKNGLVKETLLAIGFGLAGGIALAVMAIALVVVRGGELEHAMRWGRAVAVIAGGGGLVYSGLVIFSEGNAWRDAFIFHFRPGKTKRTLEDELQPRDEDKKPFFAALPRKYVGLLVSGGLLLSSVLVELVLFSLA